MYVHSKQCTGAIPCHERVKGHGFRDRREELQTVNCKLVGMKTNTIENIIENLFYVIPIIHKKLLRIDPPDIKPPLALSRVQVAVMGIIKDEGPLPISEIGKRLLIPKPQMTHVISRMVNIGVIEKQPCPNDKRIINIGLTASGILTARQIDEFLKHNVRKNLSYLTSKELEELSFLLVKLRELGSRL